MKKMYKATVLYGVCIVFGSFMFIYQFSIFKESYYIDKKKYH